MQNTWFFTNKFPTRNSEQQTEKKQMVELYLELRGQQCIMCSTIRIGINI